MKAGAVDVVAAVLRAHVGNAGALREACRAIRMMFDMANQGSLKCSVAYTVAYLKFNYWSRLSEATPTETAVDRF